MCLIYFLSHFPIECKPDYLTNTGQIPAPNNITLVLVKWFPPAVKVILLLIIKIKFLKLFQLLKVQWQLNQTNVANVKEMQIFYNPVKSR